MTDELPRNQDGNTIKTFVDLRRNIGGAITTGLLLFPLVGCGQDEMRGNIIYAPTQTPESSLTHDKCKEITETSPDDFTDDKVKEIRENENYEPIVSNESIEIYRPKDKVDERYDRLLNEVAKEIDKDLFLKEIGINKKLFIFEKGMIDPAGVLSNRAIQLSFFNVVKYWANEMGVDPENDDQMKKTLKLFVYHEAIHSEYFGIKTHTSQELGREILLNGESLEDENGTSFQTNGFITYTTCVDQKSGKIYVKKLEGVFEEALTRAILTLNLVEDERNLADELAIYPKGKPASYEAEYRLLLEILQLSPDLNKSIKDLLDIKKTGDICNGFNELYKLVNLSSKSDSEKDELRKKLQGMENKAFKVWKK